MTAAVPHAGQTWQTESYVTNAGFVAELGMPVFDLLAPKKGERILDLGCGDGRLTEKIAAVGAQVVGCDASPDLLASAKARGIETVHADGHALPFNTEFDAVFSNAAMHWMTRPKEVIAGVHRALKPGGRFVAEMGGYGNVAAISTALLAVLARRGIDGRKTYPWFFPSPKEYAGLLEAGDFHVREIALIPRPTPLPTGMAGWLDTFVNPLVGGLSTDERSKVLAETTDLLATSLRDFEGNWIADYVRLRFAATKA
ncbi:MAG TPA: class I SAM-dependent methyltransferase [Magnetospirillaceae bacterium]|jgi:SAM-dependent methyltransferase